MTADINHLDQYVGRYVRITEENGDGGEGYVVNVLDRVEYVPQATRGVVFDYGMGWQVSQSTSIEEVRPYGDVPAPEVENPVRAMHRPMEDEPCRDPDSCPNERQAKAALYAFRRWSLRQDDAYWRREWVNKARGFMDDPHSISEIARDARDEGAPPYICEELREMGRRALEMQEKESK